MLRRSLAGIPLWSLAVPVAACILLALAWGRVLPLAATAGIGAVLVATVLVAVYHAEVVAHRVGDPYGALVLALAVTVIELALILSMMLGDDPASKELARDTVFATVMIVCNGVIGLCLLVGSLRHDVITFRVDGTSPGFAVLATLATMSLVLPAFTFTTAGPTYSRGQLAFAGIASLALWAVYVFVQTVRHRGDFLDDDSGDARGPAEPPGDVAAWASLGMLLASLVGVVGLAKLIAPAIESAVASAGLPTAAVGVAIALMVLMPETLAAVREAARNRMQNSLNLALGSALATIGLTIPAVATASIMLDLPLDLGLPPKDLALLALTLLLATLTLGSGRATVLQGAVHLVVFVAFVFLTLVP
jgi:Ca2+:H+ antiporter